MDATLWPHVSGVADAGHTATVFATVDLRLGWFMFPSRL